MKTIFLKLENATLSKSSAPYYQTKNKHTFHNLKTQFIDSTITFWAFAQG